MLACCTAAFVVVICMGDPRYSKKSAKFKVAGLQAWHDVLIQVKFDVEELTIASFSHARFPTWSVNTDGYVSPQMFQIRQVCAFWPRKGDMKMKFGREEHAIDIVLRAKFHTDRWRGAEGGAPKLKIWNLQLSYRLCGDSAMLMISSILVHVTSEIEKAADRRTPHV